ncbi:hypothetical protein IR012_14855 [Pseudomonas putida]|uniref:hypothetical protein n=1 Tax=Pseudomonas putida TaxID=303 RepID=UPI0018A8DD99|nr:hypothetical protein [Pseudomonas putida]MBF8670789.1 hypothetical protein [Pseudomonas putida]MBF8713581.1 hypothetical protein [Pseudomonas putida]
MTFNKEKALEDFDDFLFIMDDQLEWLELEAARRDITLNLNTTCFPELENLFDLLSKDETKDMTSRLIVTFARYLGEAVRVRYGGKWTLPLDDPHNVNFNTPVITGHSPIEGLEFSPIFVMRGYSFKRIKGMLKRAVDADITPTPIDLDNLIEKDPTRNDLN